MQDPIRILHLEDDPFDAELALDQLQQHALACDVRLTRNRAEFEQALAADEFDVVLSDFSLPDYDGMSALLQVRAKRPDMPFILISGTLGEEQAVDCMIRGATDYVLKQRLSRLAPAVSRALDAARDRKMRRKAEDALKTSETEFRTMFEMASIGMAQADPITGLFLHVNQRLCSITGYSAQEMLQMRFADLTHPDDRALDLERFNRLANGQQTEYRTEKRYICKSGEVAWVCVNARMLFDSAGKPLRSIATIEDITAQKVIAEANARLAMAVDQAAEVVVITDADAKILYTNPAFEKTTGYTRQEAAGQNPSLLKSGKQDSAFYEKMWAKLTAKQVWSGHLVNRRKDGTLYEEEATISPVIDSAGNTVNYVAVKRDVTHEVELEAQNREAARMEAIGLLAGGVAHDFNNQLTILLHCAQMLTRALPADHPQQEDLQDILAAVQRSTELTRQLLTFSRKQSIEPVLMDINEAISGSLKMLNRLVGENIKLTFEGGPRIGQIYMDPHQLDQILANLTVNARDAIAGIGSITIQTSAVTLGEEECRNRVDFVPPGEYVVLVFSDDGAGIPEEIQSRIFEPFFTTKAIGKGTGLGLSTVYGIVKQNSGAIVVRSAKGKGATFTIYLPRPAALADAKKKPSALLSVSGTETILVVEDEPTVLRLVRRSLERRGYTVLEANSPNAALRMSDQYPSVIHLLLTDVIMPEMSGKDLAEQLLLRRPDIRVLFMSGYTSDVMQDQGHLPSGWYVLQKPIVEEVLVAHVRDALNKRAAASVGT